MFPTAPFKSAPHICTHLNAELSGFKGWQDSSASCVKVWAISPCPHDPTKTSWRNLPTYRAYTYTKEPEYQLAMLHHTPCLHTPDHGVYYCPDYPLLFPSSPSMLPVLTQHDLLLLTQIAALFSPQHTPLSSTWEFACSVTALIAPPIIMSIHTYTDTGSRTKFFFDPLS